MVFVVHTHRDYPQKCPVQLCPEIFPWPNMSRLFMSLMTQICPVLNMSHPFMSHIIIRYLAQICPVPFMSQNQICPPNLCPIPSWTIQTNYVRPIYVPYHLEPYGPIMSGLFLSHAITNNMDQLCPVPFMSHTKYVLAIYVPYHHHPLFCPNISWPIYVPKPNMSAQFMSQLETINFWWW